MTTGKEEVELTERQMEAVRLFARGLSQREIAEEMQCKPRTVKQHLTMARLKLGLKTSREIPYELHKRGIDVYPQK